uniref:Secreted protein n=1 Tax=Cacopsylla melanoneura TaxID=428564 RepID=A0A8D8XH14_9HEMI
MRFGSFALVMRFGSLFVLVMRLDSFVTLSESFNLPTGDCETLSDCLMTDAAGDSKFAEPEMDNNLSLISSTMILGEKSIPTGKLHAARRSLSLFCPIDLFV